MYITWSFLVFWTLVEENKRCNDGGAGNQAETAKGAQKTISNCATLCSHEGASMFRYGTNDFGGSNCHVRDGCQCYCEKSASSDGSCPMTVATGYYLFKYTTINSGLTFVYNKLI